jgi:hypothetical protein
MIQGMIDGKIAEFLAKEAANNNVAFNEVEAGMKLQERKDKNGNVVGFSPYYYLRVNGKFVRYVELDEII